MYKWRFTMHVYVDGDYDREEIEVFRRDSKELASINASSILAKRNEGAEEGEKYEWYGLARISS